jgi:hypothetical protein
MQSGHSPAISFQQVLWNRIVHSPLINVDIDTSLAFIALSGSTALLASRLKSSKGQVGLCIILTAVAVAVAVPTWTMSSSFFSCHLNKIPALLLQCIRGNDRAIVARQFVRDSRLVGDFTFIKGWLEVYPALFVNSCEIEYPFWLWKCLGDQVEDLHWRAWHSMRRARLDHHSRVVTYQYRSLNDESVGRAQNMWRHPGGRSIFAGIIKQTRHVTCNSSVRTWS